MDESADRIDIFTITDGARTVGVASAEIRNVITGGRALEHSGALLAESRAAGRFFTLGRLLCRADDESPSSVLVVRTPAGTDFLLGFDGIMDVTRVAVADVRPVPPYVRARQRPFVVWGFCGRGQGSLMLVTFHYLSQEGAP